MQFDDALRSCSCTANALVCAVHASAANVERLKLPCYIGRMTDERIQLGSLSDAGLIEEVKRLTEGDRSADRRARRAGARRLYLGEGYSSLFTYCTHVLHLSEHAAYGRIEAARVARKFPVVLERLVDGSVTLTNIGLLAPHLNAENHNELLDAAQHKSKRDVEHIVASLRPHPDVPSRVRKVPEPKPQAGVPAAMGTPPTQSPEPPIHPPARPTIAPLAAERYKVQFTMARETYEKLRRVQDLLRHSVPNGDPAAIFDRALTLLLKELERTKLAGSSRPRAARQLKPNSRTIPAAVKREVYMRDRGRCAFVGTNGPCGETGFLEFHHVVPYADGGEATAANIELRCRAHNAYEAEQRFGTLFVREVRGEFELGPALVSGNRRK
jgi:hypothetical protein